jgi:magnesium transporter
MADPVTNDSNVAADGEEIFAVSRAFEREIEAILDSDSPGDVRAFLADYDPADVADVLEILPRDYRRRLALELGDALEGEVLPRLDDAVMKSLVEELPSEVIARAIHELDEDDAVELLEDVDEARQDEILALVPAPDRRVVREGLSFPEESAGRLMQRDLIAVPDFWTVGQVIDYCRETDDLPDDFYEIFVVDPAYHPLGSVALNTLMRCKRPTLLRDIMDKGGTIIPVSMDQEEVAYLFQQYRMTSAPVTDENGRLVGVIMFDDIAEVIEEETEEDMMRLSGVVADGDLFEPALRTVRTRSTWLLVNLATAILASGVIALFEAAIEKIVALAILMPIVASMGGNAGTQTLAVAVRALATREVTAANAGRVVGKEALVGAVNGVVFALVMGLIAAAWFQSPSIGWVIAAAMVVNMLVAGVAGALIPLALARVGVDPAVAAGVFVTTVTDVIGFLAFLGLAALFLL